MNKAAIIFAKNIGHWTANDTTEREAAIQQIFGRVGIYKKFKITF